MLIDHDIIYIAGHDFSLDDCRISTDHIAQQLAPHNRILYVESVGLRQPRLDKADLGRIGRKLVRFIRPPCQVGQGFWVMTPLAVPLHHLPAVRRLNQALLLARSVGQHSPEVSETDSVRLFAPHGRMSATWESRYPSTIAPTSTLHSQSEREQHPACREGAAPEGHAGVRHVSGDPQEQEKDQSQLPLQPSRCRL